MSIGWGIISTGRHPDLKVVPAMKVAENTKVAAVYSRDIGIAEAFAQKHGIPKAYDSSTVCFPILKSTRSILPRQTLYMLRMRLRLRSSENTFLWKSQWPLVFQRPSI